MAYVSDDDRRSNGRRSEKRRSDDRSSVRRSNGRRSERRRSHDWSSDDRSSVDRSSDGRSSDDRGSDNQRSKDRKSGHRKSSKRSGYSRKLSKEEAEEIMELEARSKEFWSVDFSYDNANRLQDAVDVIYNTVPGNKYEVDYMESQNGTRLIIRCVTCSKELTSYDPFVTHDKGKPHNKVRQQQLNPKDPNLKGTLKRKPHNELKGIFPKKSLEDRVDLTTENVLGMQFVYKEVINGKDKFTCQLCQRDEDVVAIRTSKMFHHVKSKPHLKKYMQVKFGYLKTPYSQFYEEVESIEKMEGKIHSSVVDFTKHLITKEAARLTSSNFEPIRIKKERRSSSLVPKKRRYSRRSSSEGDSSESSCSLRIRRSRSRSRFSPPGGSSKNSRTPSPSLFNILIKKEPVSPQRAPPPPPPPPSPPPPVPLQPKLLLRLPRTPSPPPQPPPLLFPTKPIMLDKETSTDLVTAQSLSSQAKILHSKDAQEQLLEDAVMQELLHQTLIVLNDRLFNYYTKMNTFCWDDKGNLVNKAADCAQGLLKKHIEKICVISPEEE